MDQGGLRYDFAAIIEHTIVVVMIKMFISEAQVCADFLTCKSTNSGTINADTEAW